VRDTEVERFAARLVFAAIFVCLAACGGSEQRTSDATLKSFPNPTPAPTPSLDAAGRAAIAQVRAAFPVRIRPCVIYLRAKAPKEFGQDDLDYMGFPDRGLVISYDPLGERDALMHPNRSYQILYYYGRVQPDSNAIYWPDGGEYALPANQRIDVRKGAVCKVSDTS
jgi:hypothetical protein